MYFFNCPGIFQISTKSLNSYFNVLNNNFCFNQQVFVFVSKKCFYYAFFSFSLKFLFLGLFSPSIFFFFIKILVYFACFFSDFLELFFLFLVIASCHFYIEIKKYIKTMIYIYIEKKLYYNIFYML